MSRLFHMLRLVTGVVVASVITLAADPAFPQDYPRLALYGSMHSDGYPMWDSTGTLNPTWMSNLARFQTIAVDASPLTEYRPSAAADLRARRPGITLLAYVNGHYTWFAANADSFVHYPTRYNRLVRDLDGYLYNTYGEFYGTRFQQFANVNLAKRDLAGRYVVAEALADLFYDAIVSTGTWDGLFIDTYCDDISWMEASGESIDVARAGYPDRASFFAAWRAGSDTLASRLRARSGNGVILCGNCGPGTKYPWFNGWMRENFPFQNGGDWFQNMFRDPGGYFVDEARFMTPRLNWIFTAIWVGNDPYSATSTRQARFGLGSASLGDGYGVIGVPERNLKLEPYHEWWYDEYAVDLTTGQSSTQQQHTGWLGQPLGPAHQMIWIGPAADASTNPDFEADVTTGWSFWTQVGSTLSHDTGTAGSGNASARISVPTAGAAGWSTTLATTGSIPVSLGQQYSATFWAKAAVNRSARVAAGVAGGGGSYASQAFDLTTEWQRYQIVLVPNASGYAELEFHLAGETGDVWIDDAHFQAGVTNLWRRDFQNGIVLVNPAAQTLTVPLSRAYRKIAGAVDPLTNDGAIVTQVSVPASDALFLIGDDQIAPEDVADLRPLPPGAPGIP